MPGSYSLWHHQAMSMLPDGFADLFEALPDAVPDVRYATPHNCTGTVLPGYAGQRAWCDAAMVPLLQEAAEGLRMRGFRLVVFDAYRPLRAARWMGDWARRTDRAWLLDGYISETSRHCKGTAIDVSLVREDGVRVDMGTDFDAFGPAGHTLNAEGDALKHRLLLKSAMCGAGFEDYRREWWHFDLPGWERALRDEVYG